MKSHVSESDLALFISGDLNLWRTLVTRLHLAGCDECRRSAGEFRADREHVRRLADELPASLDWDRIAAEMTANIHLGLAAGECVAPRRRKSTRILPALGWRPAAITAGAALILTIGWWLNMPRSTTEALGRAFTAVIHGHGSVLPVPPSSSIDESGVVVAASDQGVELRENGGSMGISGGSAPPVAVSVSVQGSASARYIDPDTGQVAITSVGYAQ